MTNSINFIKKHWSILILFNIIQIDFNEINFGNYETISLIILTLPMIIYGFKRLYLLSKLTTNK